MSNIRESSLFGAATPANHEKQKIYPELHGANSRKLYSNVRYTSPGVGEDSRSRIF